jgi:hypothetical protein
MAAKKEQPGPSGFDMVRAVGRLCLCQVGGDVSEVNVVRYLNECARANV